MKRAIFILVALGCLMTMMATADITGRVPGKDRGVAVSTNQFGYDLSRTVTTNDTSLAADTKDWASIGSVFHGVPIEWSNVSISFYAYGDGAGAGSPDGGTFDFAIYVARKYGGAVLVCSQNDATIGKMRLSHNPNSGEALGDGTADLNYCWCDTTAVSADWATGVLESNDDGADEQAAINFDLLGARGIYIIINDMTSVTSVTYSITGFGG